MINISNRKNWLVAGSLGIFVVLTLGFFAVGCGSDGDDTATANAGETAQPIDSITVSGEGLVKAGPDEATLTVTVETDAPDARQALDANSKQTSQVLERLQAEGLDEASLQTSNVAVYPNRRWNPQSGQETIEGYRAQNSIRVTVGERDPAGVLRAVTLTG